MEQSIYTYECEAITGELIPLEDFREKVVLIVNTASRCGFTQQYDSLQTLYDYFDQKSFSILGFPCNQFARQEKGTSKEIQAFCQLNFGVTFPLFKKINVNGNDTIPLYRYLKSSARGFLGSHAIKWNFTKFLVNQQGKVIKRYSPMVKPESIKKDIERLLAISADFEATSS